MRRYEIVVESIKDQIDITILAKFLANNIEAFTKKMPHCTQFTLSDIGRILKINLPNTYSNEIKNILANKYKFKLDNKIPLAYHGAYIGKETSNNPGYIAINVKGLIDNGRLEATIAHEMQHAIDNVKSKGKYNKLINQNDLADIDYLNLPNEINARFMEVLVHLIKAKPTKELLEPIIILLFHQHHLNRDIFYNNNKGQQQYNKLLKRAYKFYLELSEIPKDNKNTWLNRVKMLLNKFKLA